MDSGFLAASAGALGKLGFQDLQEIDFTRSEDLFRGFVWRLPFIIAMIVCNSLMISRYVKALEKCSSVLQVQGVNFTVNFLTSVFYGVCFFNEGIEKLSSVKFWIGSCLMILGVILLQDSNSTKQKTN